MELESTPRKIEAPPKWALDTKSRNGSKIIFALLGVRSTCSAVDGLFKRNEKGNSTKFPISSCGKGCGAFGGNQLLPTTKTICLERLPLNLHLLKNSCLRKKTTYFPVKGIDVPPGHIYVFPGDEEADGSPGSYLSPRVTPRRPDQLVADG